MTSKAIVTVTRMLESLPLDVQDRVVEHLREYIEDLQDEIRWDEAFQRNPEKLVAMARQAKQEIAEGKATEMNLENARKIFRKYVPAGRNLSEELIQERRVEASRE